MNNISIVVAIAENNAIGKNNELLWHLPKDLKFFKQVTSGNTVIMGRKTYDSIGKPLPNRRNIVISKQPNLVIAGAEVFNSLETALKNCIHEKEIFIIGGASIYKEVLPFCNRIYLTKVHHSFNADVYFPEANFSDWKILSEENHYKDEKHLYDFTFLIMENK